MSTGRTSTAPLSAPTSRSSLWPTPRYAPSAYPSYSSYTPAASTTHVSLGTWTPPDSCQGQAPTLTWDSGRFSEPSILALNQFYLTTVTENGEPATSTVGYECFPPGYRFDDDGDFYFTPGVCPIGYHQASSTLISSYTKTETEGYCCPSSYSAYSSGIGCYSDLVSHTAPIVGYEFKSASALVNSTTVTFYDAVTAVSAFAAATVMAAYPSMTAPPQVIRPAVLIRYGGPGGTGGTGGTGGSNTSSGSSFGTQRVGALRLTTLIAIIAAAVFCLIILCAYGYYRSRRNARPTMVVVPNQNPTPRPIVNNPTWAPTPQNVYPSPTAGYPPPMTAFNPRRSEMPAYNPTRLEMPANNPTRPEMPANNLTRPEMPANNPTRPEMPANNPTRPEMSAYNPRRSEMPAYVPPPAQPNRGLTDAPPTNPFARPPGPAIPRPPPAVPRPPPAPATPAPAYPFGSTGPGGVFSDSEAGGNGDDADALGTEEEDALAREALAAIIADALATSEPSRPQGPSRSPPRFAVPALPPSQVPSPPPASRPPPPIQPNNNPFTNDIAMRNPPSPARSPVPESEFLNTLLSPAGPSRPRFVVPAASDAQNPAPPVAHAVARRPTHGESLANKMDLEPMTLSSSRNTRDITAAEVRECRELVQRLKDGQSSAQRGVHKAISRMASCRDAWNAEDWDRVLEIIRRLRVQYGIEISV